jgi:lipid-binding SYLF domain-containing protein
MRGQLFACCVVIAFGFIPTLSHAEMSAKEKDSARAEIRKDVKATLNKLYKLQPKSKSLIGGAAGYAVINNFGVKILVAGSGTGKGIAYDKSGKETFMKMAELQAGLGMGAKKFSLVWVFENEAGLKKFISGSFEMSGQANATAQVDKKGAAYAGAAAVSPGVWLYQLQGDGLSLELTAKGTKYYLYDELN